MLFSKPMTKDAQKYLPVIQEARLILLDLHKKLIDVSRADYEAENGAVATPSDWIPLLVGDPFFAFLHPLSKLITTFDELLEITWPLRELDAAAVRAEIENIIGDYPTTPPTFRTKYLDMIQRIPDVVLLHAKLKKSIQDLPPHEPDKMLELLNVRTHWSAGSKMKHFRPGSKKPS
jgi:hypothetical protein